MDFDRIIKQGLKELAQWERREEEKIIALENKLLDDPDIETAEYERIMTEARANMDERREAGNFT